jgi:putative DNA primase/helicase
MSAAAEFRDAIAASGLTPPNEIIGDGERHRFSSDGRPSNKSGWYRFHDDERPAGAFGCWRTDMSVTWKSSKPQQFTEAEREQYRERMQRLEKQRAREREEATDYAAVTAAQMWNEAVVADHPYLERKQITCLGARVLGDMLLVPMKHSAKELVGLQRIWPDGTKRFIKGSPLAGAYCTIGTPTKDGTVVICEGYATGVSIHLATNYCVVVAFNSGNLAEVSQKIRRALPSARLIIAGDDDAFTVRPPNHVQAGQPWNPGIEAATATGFPVYLPVWHGGRDSGTDFNDLHVAEGLKAVRACFKSPATLSPPGSVSDKPTVKPVSDGGDRAPDNTGSLGGVPPFASDQAVHDEPARPVILPGGGSDVQILPAVIDQYAPECSDDDLAARHLDRMKLNTLWCEMWGRWLVWNGDRWLRDETNMVFDVVRQSCRLAANTVLENLEMDSAKRQRQADKIASYRTISAVERLSRAYRVVATHPDEWDKDIWALNTPGGVVDLRDGSLRPHSRDDRFTKITAVAPGGSCPSWLSFLDRATGGDKELIGFLRRMCGYALTGEVREHALFFVYGTGGNGKGTFLNTITHIMGDYQRVSGSETFTESPGDRHTTELARLQGARLVTAQETEEGKRWAESRIKSLTGGDPITARYMRQDDFTFLPQFKLVIVGNHKPSFRNVDDAIRRRLHLVPFTAVIPGSEKDPMLSEKLKAEAPGILQWMIDGCIEWARDGLLPPSVVKQSTDEYLGSEDSLQQWMDECCDLERGGFSSSKALFFSWTKWCELSGEYVGTMKRLMAKLESRNISTGQKFQGVRGCIGIKIKSGDEDDEPNPF